MTLTLESVHAPQGRQDICLRAPDRFATFAPLRMIVRVEVARADPPQGNTEQGQKHHV
jgi:hypothetical protein